MTPAGDRQKSGPPETRAAQYALRWMSRLAGGITASYARAAALAGATAPSIWRSLIRTRCATESMCSAHRPQHSSSSNPKCCRIRVGVSTPARAASTASETLIALHTHRNIGSPKSAMCFKNLWASIYSHQAFVSTHNQRSCVPAFGSSSESGFAGFQDYQD